MVFCAAGFLFWIFCLFVCFNFKELAVKLHLVPSTELGLGSLPTSVEGKMKSIDRIFLHLSPIHLV